MTKPLGDVDPNVKLPKAVLAQTARVNEIHNASYKKDEPKVEPAKEPAKPAEPAAVEPVKPAEPAAAEPAKVTPEVTPATAKEVVDWEARYNAMKGRFARSERANKDLNDRLSNMEQLIATMQVPTPEPANQPDFIPELHITKKDVEEFGEDFIGVARRAAREEAAPRIAQLEKALSDAQKKIDQLSGTVGRTAEHVALTARQQMHNDLDTALPNWKTINEDQKFLDWLDLPDTYSGAKRLNLLKAAYDANDASRVQAFFRGFLASEAATVPQDPAAPTPAPAVEKVPLETFAAPGRAKTAPTPVAAEKPLITRAQITQFYLDVSRGKYKGKDEEKAKAELQIQEAMRDGRIR